MIIHGSLLTAVHVQPAPAVTSTLPELPDEVYESLVGAIEKLQPEAWLTVNVCPAMVIVPLLAGPPVLSKTEYHTSPPPEPVAPEAMDIHESLLVAVQSQLTGVDTVT